MVIKHIIRVSSIVFGAVLLVVGIAGIFLPVIPGIVLILLGLVFILGRKKAELLVKNWRKKGQAFFGRKEP